MLYSSYVPGPFFYPEEDPNLIDPASNTRLSPPTPISDRKGAAQGRCFDTGTI